MSSVETIEIDEIPPESTVDPPLDQTIPRLSADTLSFDRFFTEFMTLNRPVIITNVSKDWTCHQRWIRPDGALDTTYLKEWLADRPVPIANCSKQYFNSHEKTETSLHKFLEYWSEPCTGELLYLKDWHLRQEEPDYEFYQVPEWFASDWLNEFLIDTKADDYRFVYFGRKGTWTSFHADVFGSYSWSTNILGRKKWLFLVPNEEAKLLDRLNNLPFSVTTELLDQKSVRYYEIYQNPGEAIFVPSRWYHQVVNEADTVSINHNWFNGCNVEVIYRNLCDSYASVLREIDDCREMEAFFEHSQLMLRSLHGMNFESFVQILRHIAEKRMRRLDNGEEFRVFDRFRFGDRLIRYDLIKIECILRKTQTEDDNWAEKLGLADEIRQLIDKIQATINS